MMRDETYHGRMDAKKPSILNLIDYAQQTTSSFATS